MPKLVIRRLNTIPEYPRFKTIDHMDSYILRILTDDFDPYSDFILSNLVGWGNAKSISQIATYNNNVVIKFLDNLGERIVCSILGNSLNGEDILRITECETSLHYVPEVSLTSVKNRLPAKLKVEQDRDNFDYIYLVSDIVNLNKDRLENRRKEIEDFVRDNPNIETRLLDLQDPYIRLTILKFYDNWLSNKNPYSINNSLIEENNHFKYVLDHISDFNYFCIGIYMENTLIGFSVVEIIGSLWGLNSFSKPDHSIHNLSQYIMYATAIECGKRGIKYINLEPDLGVLGLRETKSAWMPVKYLKKYTIKIN